MYCPKGRCCVRDSWCTILAKALSTLAEMYQHCSFDSLRRCLSLFLSSPTEIVHPYKCHTSNSFLK